MKVLLLTPVLDAQQSGEKALKAAGHAVLLARDEAECEKLRQIHGLSIDLFVLHREGAEGRGTPGLKVYSALKQKPETREVPVILLTSEWSEKQCQEHQSDAHQGAHAYLRFPFPQENLVATIQQIFGLNESDARDVGAALPPPVLVSEEGGVQLEDATGFHSAPESESSSKIRLEPSGGAGISLQAEPAALPPAAPEGGGIELGALPDAGGIELGAISPSAPDVDSGASLPPAPEAELSIHIESTRVEDSAQAPVAAAVDFERTVEPTEEPTGPNPYEQQFGYLLAGALKNRNPRSTGSSRTPPPAYALPEIPKGDANTADLHTLRQYLAMREQDVGVLSAQMKALREQVQIYEAAITEKESENGDLTKRVADLESAKEHFETEKQLAVELERKRGKDREFELQAKADRAQSIQKALEQTQREVELIRERVRTDLRKIRVRERELENRLELARKDAESLIAVRENRIIEVKRKLDITEFNFDLLHEKYEREKENAARLREKLDRASRAMRVAGGVLEDAPDTPSGEKAG